MTSGKPNIWYISHYAGGPGIGRHYRGWHLCHQWLRQGIKGTVMLASQHHMLDAAQQPGARPVRGVDYAFVETHAYKGNGLKRFWGMLSFTWSMIRHYRDLVEVHGRPDMVIGSSPHPFTFLASHYIARRTGARSVLEVRDLWPESIQEMLNVSRWNPVIQLMLWIERYAYSRADHVVSLLPNTQDYMRQRGLPEGRWHYIPNGIDTSEVMTPVKGGPISGQIDEWHREGRIVIAYTGALGVPNRVESLIDAMAIALRRGEKVSALIIGRGELEDDLRKKCDALALGEHVRFFPQVPRSEALNVLSGVDVGYISLKRSPLFRFGISPNKMFDYMLAAIPIVSAIDAGNDLVRQAGCGISLHDGDAGDIADAFALLARMTREERHTLGCKGRHYAEREHDFSVLATRYASLL